MAASTHDSTARAILYAFLANFGIAIAKSWAAVVTGSGSMLAEAIHSYADTGNQVLLYLGLKQSQRPADDEHPLGYGKLSYFWSFVVAILLFSMGGIFSIYEGLHKLQHPEPLSQIWIAIVVLILAIILEGSSLFGALREIKKVRGERPFRAWLKHTRNSELVVVLGEDIGAQLGLILALGFLMLAMITGNPIYDALGSICIGVVLIVISVFVGWRVRALLVGRSADPDIQEAINAIIAEQDAIEHVFKTITVQFGPDTMLAAKIKMRSGQSIDEAVQNINALERELKARVPKLKWCFIEPDVVEALLDGLGQVEHDAPIVGRFNPRAHHKIDAAIGECGDGNGRGGFRENPILNGEDVFERFSNLVEIVAVTDADHHVDAACVVR
jgi:cation diffusion facilitator family transporter